jgi:DNA polymerase-3 subunit alpha/error-prone DNA polymerase
VGKVFGLPKEELDALAKPIQLHDTNSVVALQKYGMLLENIPINAACIPAEY